MPTLDLSWTPQQREVFFPESHKRFTAVAKGRRFGATRGAAHACIQWSLEGKAILWGDTIHGNIERYWDRYFEPVLKRSDVPWKFDRVAKVAKIGRGYIDFRSADKPENWEGFGYHKIILNEAGIILQDRYLYTNAVLPMLMDHTGSELYALGVPKGKHLRDGSEHPFFTIYKRGEEGDPDVRSLRYSSYDNPLLTEEDVTDLRDWIERMSKGEEQQEIYGHFIEHQGGNEFFHAFRISEHASTPVPYDPDLAIHATLDFNSNPYMTLLVAQIRRPGPGSLKWRLGYMHEYCFEHPLNTTRDVCIALRTDLVTGRYAGHRAGLFVYGDYTGKSSNTMATETERHNYDIVFNVLSRWASGGNSDRVRPNPPHVMARDFMNDTFGGRTSVEIAIDPSMTNTIRDLSTLRQAADGGILKEMETDPQTKIRYEKGGHCAQALYYLPCSAFRDIFDEHGRRAA